MCTKITFPKSLICRRCSAVISGRIASNANTKRKCYFATVPIQARKLTCPDLDGHQPPHHNFERRTNHVQENRFPRRSSQATRESGQTYRRTRLLSQRSRRTIRLLTRIRPKMERSQYTKTRSRTRTTNGAGRRRGSGNVECIRTDCVFPVSVYNYLVSREGR